MSPEGAMRLSMIDRFFLAAVVMFVLPLAGAFAASPVPTASTPLPFSTASVVATQVPAAGAVLFDFRPSERFTLVEKYNYRLRENGAYKGFVYREVRGNLTRDEAAWSTSGQARYAGSAAEFESGRQAGQVARRIERVVPAVLQIDAAGTWAVPQEQAFPAMRGFPGSPREAVAPGGSWQAHAVRVVDPRSDGTSTRVPVYVDYRYQGLQSWNGHAGHRITAKYAVRYRQGQDPAGDPSLVQASGTHDVSIFVPVEPDGPRFMTETYKEEYRYNDGTTLTHEGSIASFLNSFIALDRPAVVAQTQSAIQQSQLPDVRVEERTEGVAIAIDGLRFAPDSARLLPQEEARLDGIAELLKTTGNRSLRVEGHTASTGRPAGEMTLSIDRAKAIVDALIKRGIDAARLSYRGLGSTVPLAPNDSEAGRAKNRRVEIIIVDD